jgi:sodium/pantothenate symporter
MFGIFTTVGVISVLVVASDAGGWYNAVISLASNPETRDLLSWSGKLGYMYDTGLENFIWYLGYGICWAGVSICAPWQCTRNIMAKNEHTIIRSAVFVVIGCFAINYIVEIGATFFHLFDIGETASTQVYVWAAMNLLPPVLGVILITGIIAAGISSSTTFLSLIGSSIANDLFKTQDENKKVLVSKASMIVVALIVIFIACTNPANIWWIMQIGATVVICSLLPPAIASIWSKKTTKAGAFAGMLVGFTVSFLMKIIGTSLGITYPIYCDVYFVATAANIIAMLVVNRFTTVSNVEMERREALFVVPSGESDVIEIEKTRKAIKSLIWIGLGISIFCIITWVIPYNIGLTL